ncbi:MAG: hypothetical protein WAQ05_02700 [Rubrivivax sp.]
MEQAGMVALFIGAPDYEFVISVLVFKQVALAILHPDTMQGVT